MEVRRLHSKRRRSQAAITDAIILLLVTTFASVLVFSFIGTWGNDHDAVLRSAYVLNYMQSVSKSMYYIDASTLNGIGSDGLYVYKYALKDSGNGIAFDTVNSPKEYDLGDSNKGCPYLAYYPGTLRVTDLLKRDLADDNPQDNSQGVSDHLPKLDDKFGDAAVPGRTAMRCAVKELMKPFSFSGYKYYFEVLSLESPHDSEGEGDYVSYYGPEITNSNDSKIVGVHVDLAQPKRTRIPNGGSDIPGCKAVLRTGYDVLSVSSPFQVLYSKSSADSLDVRFVKYKTRICIWRSKEGV